LAGHEKWLTNAKSSRLQIGHEANFHLDRDWMFSP